MRDGVPMERFSVGPRQWNRADVMWPAVGLGFGTVCYKTNERVVECHVCSVC